MDSSVSRCGAGADKFRQSSANTDTEKHPFRIRLPVVVARIPYRNQTPHLKKPISQFQKNITRRQTKEIDNSVNAIDARSQKCYTHPSIALLPAHLALSSAIAGIPNKEQWWNSKGGGGLTLNRPRNRRRPRHNPSRCQHAASKRVPPYFRKGS